MRRDSKIAYAILSCVALVPTLGFFWTVLISRNEPVLYSGLTSLSFIAIVVAAGLFMKRHDSLAIAIGVLHPVLYAVARIIHDRSIVRDFAYWVSILLAIAIVVLVVHRRSCPEVWRDSSRSSD